MNQPFIVGERLIQAALYNMFQILRWASILPKIDSNPQFFKNLSHLRSYSFDHAGSFKDFLRNMIHLLWKKNASWGRGQSVLSNKRQRPSEDQTPPVIDQASSSTVDASQIEEFALPGGSGSGQHRMKAAEEFNTAQGFAFRTGRCYDVVLEDHTHR